MKKQIVANNDNNIYKKSIEIMDFLSKIVQIFLVSDFSELIQSFIDLANNNENIKQLKSNYMYLILMHIYYIYPKTKDFSSLITTLTEFNITDNDRLKLNSILLTPIEYFCELNNSTLHKCLVFHILDLIESYNLLIFDDEDMIKNIKNENFTKYLEILSLNNMEFKYFKNYYESYYTHDAKLLGDLVCKEVDLYFYNDKVDYSNIIVDELVTKINDITDELGLINDMEFYVNCINKVRI